MVKRGRKSAADLAIVTRIEDARPAAPDRLAAAAKAVWEQTVHRLPARWFQQETWPILEAFCVHTVTARKLTDEILRFEANTEWIRSEEGAALFDRLAKMRDRETRAALACARSLRLTKQSQLDRSSAGAIARDATGDMRKPWHA
jgi:hypothetical protein